MAHIEYLVHLAPGSAAFATDEVEERRCGEEVVLDHVFVFHEVHHLGLCSAGAVDHAMDGGTHLAEKPFDDRGIGACGREHELTGGQTGAVDGVGEKF